MNTTVTVHSGYYCSYPYRHRPRDQPRSSEKEVNEEVLSYENCEEEIRRCECRKGVDTDNVEGLCGDLSYKDEDPEGVEHKDEREEPSVDGEDGVSNMADNSYVSFWLDWYACLDASRPREKIM